MKLIDMETQEWRQDDFKRGDRWRSSHVHECMVCGCKSNEFFMMQAFWAAGPRLVCPGRDAKPDLHQLLHDKVMNSRNKEHPKKYVEMLMEEIEEMRRQFADVPPNVEGIEGEWKTGDPLP